MNDPDTNPVPAMSDEALGLALAPRADADERRRIVEALDPADRRAYERLLFVADELNAGRTPDGVMTDGPRRRG